jgi:hypothetical protein
MMGFSDFTELKGVEITINGKSFPHLNLSLPTGL